MVEDKTLVLFPFCMETKNGSMLLCWTKYDYRNTSWVQKWTPTSVTCCVNHILNQLDAQNDVSFLELIKACSVELTSGIFVVHHRQAHKQE